MAVKCYRPTLPCFFGEGLTECPELIPAESLCESAEAEKYLSGQKSISGRGMPSMRFHSETFTQSIQREVL